MIKHDLKDSEPFTDGDSLPYRIKDNRLQYIKIDGVWANSSLTIHGFDSGVKMEKTDIKTWMVKEFAKKHDIKDGEKFRMQKGSEMGDLEYFIKDNAICCPSNATSESSISCWMCVEPSELLAARVEKIDPIVEFIKKHNFQENEIFLVNLAVDKIFFKIKNSQIYVWYASCWCKSSDTLSSIEDCGAEKFDLLADFLKKHDLKENEIFIASLNGERDDYRINDSKIYILGNKGNWKLSIMDALQLDLYKIVKIDPNKEKIKEFIKKYGLKEKQEFMQKGLNSVFMIENNIIYFENSDYDKDVKPWLVSLHNEEKRLDAFLSKKTKILPPKPFNATKAIKKDHEADIQKIKEFMKMHQLVDGEVFVSDNGEFRIIDYVIQEKINNAWVDGGYTEKIFYRSITKLSFKPKLNEEYWYNAANEETIDTCNDDFTLDLLLIDRGMAYRTKETAEYYKNRDLAFYKSITQDSELKPDTLQDVPNCKYCTAPITQEVTLGFKTDKVSGSAIDVKKVFKKLETPSIGTHLDDIINQCAKTVIDEMFKEILDSHKK